MRIRPLKLPVVSTYDDQRRWMEHGLAVIFERFGDEAATRLCEASAKYTMSTAFSGTGGPETCDRSLRSAMRHFVGDVHQPPASILFCCYYCTRFNRRLFCFVVILLAHVSQLQEAGTKQILITTTAMWAIEKLEHSRAERHLIDPGMCVYGDIMDFLTPVARSDLMARCENMFFEDLEKLFLQWYNSLIVTHASCSTHGCQCTAGKSRVHVAGTPCVDWSSAGKRLGGGGATVLVYFTWVAQRLVYQEDHE